MSKLEQVKIILCDIDGTLLNSEGKVTPLTIEAIRKVREKGILFGIATGRSLAGVKHLVYDWGIGEYCDILMGFNGGTYIDKALDKKGTAFLLDGETISRILEEYKDFDYIPGIYDEDTFHALKDGPIPRRIATGNKIEFIVDDFAKYKEVGANKMLGTGEPHVINQLEAYYAEHPGVGFRAMRSTPNLFEFINPELSKTKGIEIIAANHGLTLENVCVFGDERNDLEMIRDCGVGVCMANGNPIVKEVADYITLSNNEDGIAAFIEHYLL